MHETKKKTRHNSLSFSLSATVTLIFFCNCETAFRKIYALNLVHMSGGTAAEQLLHLIFWGLLGVEPVLGRVCMSSTAVLHPPLHLPCICAAPPCSALSIELNLGMVQRNRLQWSLLVHIPWQQSKISPLLIKCSPTARDVLFKEAYESKACYLSTDGELNPLCRG